MLAKAEKILKPRSKDVEVKEEEIDDEEDDNEGSGYSEMSDEDISGDEIDIKKEEGSSDEEEEKPVKKFERKPDTAVDEGRVIFLRYSNVHNF
jgi:Skp family chaperone for outer membrane proteins